MSDIKGITVDNIDEAVEWLKTLKKCQQQRNALKVLSTFQERPDGFIVRMSEKNYRKYVKMIL